MQPKISRSNQLFCRIGIVEGERVGVLCGMAGERRSQQIDRI
jgi:hypothetical protein